jgi:hypothetical protein
MQFRNAAISMIGSAVVFGCIAGTHAAREQSASAIRDQAAGSFVFLVPGSNHPITPAEQGPCRQANADVEKRFPYGLAGSPLEPTQLATVFSRDFVVLLGDRDTSDREREAAATAQGARRKRFAEACVSLRPQRTKQRP